MKLRFLSLLLLIPYAANASFFDSDCPQPAVSGTGASFETAFTPDAHVSELVIKSIDSAKTSIKVAAHRFVSKDVSVALLNAMRANKDVKIILDKTKNDDGYSDANLFIRMSHSPHVLKHYDNQYQDYILIDDKDIIIGNISSLQTVDAEKKNAASVLVIHNVPDLVKKYSESWQKLWDDSEEMENKDLVKHTPKE
jgi:phosphatidylserine/phosphatidylglycerophosphate/cardiolipin synthase-like enzyme